MESERNGKIFYVRIITFDDDETRTRAKIERAQNTDIYINSTSYRSDTQITTEAFADGGTLWKCF